MTREIRWLTGVRMHGRWTADWEKYTWEKNKYILQFQNASQNIPHKNHRTRNSVFHGFLIWQRCRRAQDGFNLTEVTFKKSYLKDDANEKFSNFKLQPRTSLAIRTPFFLGSLNPWKT